MIVDDTKTYYVATRGNELAVLDNSRAATDLTVRGDLGVDLDLFVAGRLDVGVTAGAELNLMSLDAVGVLALRDLAGTVDGALLAPQAVGRVDLLISAGLQGIADIQGSAQLLINTLGQQFTYAIPDRLQDRLQKIQDKTPERHRPVAAAASGGRWARCRSRSRATRRSSTVRRWRTGRISCCSLVTRTRQPRRAAPPDPNGNGLVDVQHDDRRLVPAGRRFPNCRERQRI